MKKFKKQEQTIEKYLKEKWNILVVKEWFWIKNYKIVSDNPILFFGKESEKAISLEDENQNVKLWIPKSIIIKQINNGNRSIRFFAGE